MMSTSGKLTLAAFTLTTTSPAPALGEGSSSTTSDSGGPNCLQSTAFIALPWVFSARADYDRTGAPPLPLFSLRREGPRDARLQGPRLEIRADSAGHAQARRDAAHRRLPQDADLADRRRRLLRYRAHRTRARAPRAVAVALFARRDARRARVGALCRS